MSTYLTQEDRSLMWALQQARQIVEKQRSEAQKDRDIHMNFVVELDQRVAHYDDVLSRLS